MSVLDRYRILLPYCPNQSLEVKIKASYWVALERLDGICFSELLFRSRTDLCSSYLKHI